MKIIKQIKLTNTEDGHSKFWIGELYDDDTVITRWGRINGTESFKEFPNVGHIFLEKKYNEKIKKGYK